MSWKKKVDNPTIGLDTPLTSIAQYSSYKILQALSYFQHPNVIYVLGLSSLFWIWKTRHVTQASPFEVHDVKFTVKLGSWPHSFIGLVHIHIMCSKPKMEWTILYVLVHVQLSCRKAYIIQGGLIMMGGGGLMLKSFYGGGGLFSWGLRG